MSNAVAETKGAVESSSNPPVGDAKPKTRKRASRAKAIPNGDGLVSIGGNSICGYCAQVGHKFLVCPRVSGACFCTLPCMLGYVNSNVKDEPTHADLTKQILEKYKQVEGNVQAAPKRELLVAFGGELDWSTWIGPLKMWEALTQQCGQTIDEIKHDLKASVKKAKKVVKPNVIDFAKGSYMIAAGKLKAGIQCAGEQPEGETTFKPCSIESGIAKINTFRRTHFVPETETKDEAYRSYLADKANLLMVASEAKGEGDDKFLNKVASALVGETVYGPAFVVLTKKHSIKV
jgi:hypothetical protein